MIIFPRHITIEKLKVVRNSMDRKPKLIVMTTDAMVAVPLARYGNINKYLTTD